MKICFVISTIEAETAGTTVLMMKKAHERGHKTYVMGVGDFNFHYNAPISIYCKEIPKSFKAKTKEEFLLKIQDEKLKKKRLCTSELDVLFLRNNPTEEPNDRHWAEHSGIAFGRMIQNSGVLVLNDAFALSHAFIDKLYFEELPQIIKPKSIITRYKKDLIEFYEENGNKMVLKPLEGSGGQDVYLIDENERNINQIIDTISEKGYVIAQEFLPEVKDGDVRVILMNGQILEEDGTQAIIRRVSTSEDEFRSNLSLGANAEKAELTPEMKRIVDITAPKLIRDGLFFVSLDIVKDKLIEINVLSPGGLDYIEGTSMPDFTDTIIQSIEKKVEYKNYYKNSISNRQIATMT